MRKYLLFCLAFCVLGCLAQDLIVRPNDPIIYKKEGGIRLGSYFMYWIRRRSFIIWITGKKRALR